MGTTYYNASGRSSEREDSRLNRKSATPQRGHEEPELEDITLGWVLRRLFSGIKLIWIAFRYRWKRANGNTRVGGFRIPWIQIALAGIVVFLVTQKDIRFSVNLKAPLGGNFSESEGIATNVSKVERFGLGEMLPFGRKNKSAAAVSVEALDPSAVDGFLKRFSRVAVAEMRKFGIPASVKLAQGILESQAGRLPDNRKDNNYFGAPLSGEDYISAWENWRAHSILLREKYPNLFEGAFGYKQWAKGLEKSGYNSSGNYAENLVRIIEQYQLEKLDE
jgi:flagellum-specific peptidoglycan hydrolase FlgJ